VFSFNLFVTPSHCSLMAEYHTSPSRTICFHTLCALPPPPLLSSNLRYMSMHISHFLALSSSLSPQTFEFSTSHIIVDFTYCCTALRTRTRTNTNPNGTEASAAGRSGNARAMRKQSKCRMIQEGEGHWPNSSEIFQKARNLWVLRTPQNNKEEGARAKKLVTCGTRGPLSRGQSVPFSAQGAYCSAPEP